MHAVGLCEALLSAIEHRAGGVAVRAVEVRVGVLHEVSESSLRATFSVVAAGTVAGQAHFGVQIVPVHARCRSCDRAVPTSVVCDFCGSTDLRVDGGDEVVVESVTVVDTGSPWAGR
jgi:hydrogenase nickel incorporation protein HypA/HybF